MSLFAQQALLQLAARRALVTGRVRARVGSMADAEDIFQHALIRAAERLETLQDPARLEAWFDAIIRRLVLDHMQQSGRHARQQARLVTDAMALDPRSALGSDVCACSLRLVDELRPKDAQLLRMVELEERSVAQAALALGISPNYASVRLHRARASLRQKLFDTCGVSTARQCMDCGCE